MGESERYIDRRVKKIALGEDNNALIALISINAIGLIIPGLIKIIYKIVDPTSSAFYNHILPWFILPSNIVVLAKNPWTILTYMFVHTQILMAFTNMLWLWAFGSILQEMSGNKKIIPIYLYGGLAGAVVFIATSYALPQTAFPFFEGASASVMAIAIATTALAPDYRIFRMLNGGIPLWVLTVLFVIIDFVSIRSSATALHLAHFAGGLLGFFFIVALRRGHDWGAWMIRFYNWFLDLCNPDKKILTPQKTREKMFYKTGNQKPFEKHPIITQQRIDEILDKINQKGIHLLSEEEKNILKRAGEDDF